MKDTTVSMGGGDRGEWYAVIGPCLPQLNRFATRRLPATIRGTVGAEDLVQEAMMGLIRRGAGFEFRDEEAFLAYLRR